jgi:hypothetical protein
MFVTLTLSQTKNKKQKFSNNKPVTYFLLWSKKTFNTIPLNIGLKIPKIYKKILIKLL